MVVPDLLDKQVVQVALVHQDLLDKLVVQVLLVAQVAQVVQVKREVAELTLTLWFNKD